MKLSKLYEIKDDIDSLRISSNIGVSLSKDTSPYLNRIFVRNRDNAAKIISEIEKQITKAEKKLSNYPWEIIDN